jgi:hypothetical protein
MIRLLPTTEPQTIKIVPRAILEAGALDWEIEYDWNTSDFLWNREVGELIVKVTEDGTGKSESIYNPVFVEDLSGFTEITVSFSELKEGSYYYLEITNGGYNYYRDTALATTQTDFETALTLNKGKYKQYDKDEEQEYIVL